MGLVLANDAMWVVGQFIPFYFFLKIAFLVWMYHPRWNGATAIYDMAQPYIQKILNIDPSVGMVAKNALLAKRNEAAAHRSINGKAQDARRSHLVVIVKKVTLPTEKNVYVECTVLPKVGRSAEGIEGTCYKTNKVLGRTCVFNHSTTFLPLPVLDGILHIDVCEKPTFSEALSLGTADISLLDIIPGAPVTESTVALPGTEIEVVLGIELLLGEP